MAASHIFVGVILTLACIADLRTRRIPNVLTFSAAVIAVLFHAATGGWAAVGSSVSGWLLGVHLFFPMFALRGMGAGDVKLLAAVGAWLGPAQVALLRSRPASPAGCWGLSSRCAHGYLRTALSTTFARCSSTGA